MTTATSERSRTGLASSSGVAPPSAGAPALAARDVVKWFPMTITGRTIEEADDGDRQGVTV